MIAALTAELFILRPTATFLRRLSRHAASGATGGKWPTRWWAWEPYPLRKAIDTAVTSVPPCGVIVTDCLSPWVRRSRWAVNPA
jgi:hypothetical protein